MQKVEVVLADITTMDVDAIVNSANRSLLSGGGVCGAIHRAAGRALELECLRLYPEGCATGDAVVTRGFNLPAQYVIHGVGPRLSTYDSVADAAIDLASCYRRCIEEAAKLGLKSIAFPSISTGIYGFPLAEASVVAAETIAVALKDHPDIERLIICCFDEEDRVAYAAAFERQGLIRATS